MGRLETTIVLLEELGGAVLAMLVLALALAGCGGGTTTTTHTPGGGGNPRTTTQPPVPTLHVIAADTMGNPIPAGSANTIGPYTLPASTVAYQITERTTSTTQDTWTTAIAAASEIARAQAGQDYRAYGIEQAVRGTISTTATVPADTYYLLIICQNILEDCVFSYQLQATY
jgi:hypothetical protein